jgi:hypothetical protein
MGVAAGGTIVVVIIGQMQISGHEPSGNAAAAARLVARFMKMPTT